MQVDDMGFPRPPQAADDGEEPPRWCHINDDVAFPKVLDRQLLVSVQFSNGKVKDMEAIPMRFVMNMRSLWRLLSHTTSVSQPQPSSERVLILVEI